MGRSLDKNFANIGVFTK